MSYSNFSIWLGLNVNIWIIIINVKNAPIICVHTFISSLCFWNNDFKINSGVE